MTSKSSNKIIIKKTDADDDELYGVRQAFEVPIIPDDFDPSIPPTSGEEYLQHVIFEAKKFASVCVAKRISPSVQNVKCDSSQVPAKPTIQSSLLAPTQQWEDEQIDMFKKLRNKMHSLRMADKKLEKIVETPDVDAKSGEWCKFASENEPLLSVVLCLRQEKLEILLRVLQKCVGTEWFQPNYGHWIYAICVCLEHPLSREACGELRDIARKYASLRQQKTDPQDKDVVMANLFISLVVRYFGQKDLCEEA